MEGDWVFYFLLAFPMGGKKTEGEEKQKEESRGEKGETSFFLFLSLLIRV